MVVYGNYWEQLSYVFKYYFQKKKLHTFDKYSSYSACCEHCISAGMAHIPLLSFIFERLDEVFK